MAKGLWVIRVADSHPLVYDPDKTHARGGERHERGRIVDVVEGDSEAKPYLGTSTKGNAEYEAEFYAGETEDGFVALLPPDTAAAPQSPKRLKLKAVKSGTLADDVAPADKSDDQVKKQSLLNRMTGGLLG